MITARKYQPCDKQEWDRFVRDSNNGTIFNYRNFLNYHLTRNFRDHSLIFQKNHNIIGVFPAAEVEEENQKILFSHPGASFGGFIVNRISYSDMDELLISFETYCHRENFNRTFFIPTPSIYFREPDDTLEYALLWRNFTVAENYISSVIDTTGDLSEKLTAIYRKKNRSSTYYDRLVEKNDLRLEWNKDYKQFYPILLENKKRHASLPTHTLEELQKLNDLFPESFHLLMVYAGKTPIGGTLNFVANDRVAIIFYNMIDYRYSRFQPATLQVIETIKWAYRLGFRSLDFGVSQDPHADNPLTPSKKLIRFKEELTSRGMLRKAFTKTFRE
ncbi:MAG: GNAT family N-acetyltransferase [FCB group bacterium]|nr:GNAT family N-acetyltransferase [FCB group bacterium]